MSVSSPDRKTETDIPAAKARLFEAAAEVFVARGYQAARVSDIVAGAGVAQGTFYTYFRSKQAIFTELVDGFFTHLLAETLGKFPVSGVGSREDARAQIRIIWRIVLEYCRAHPALTALVMHEASALPPEERARVTRAFDVTAAALADYNRAAAGRGLLRAVNSDLAAWVVIGMLERAVHFAVFVAPEAPLDELIEDLVAIELDGLLAPGGEAQTQTEEDPK